MNNEGAISRNKKCIHIKKSRNYQNVGKQDLVQKTEALNTRESLVEITLNFCHNINAKSKGGNLTEKKSKFKKVQLHARIWNAVPGP